MSSNDERRHGRRRRLLLIGGSPSSGSTFLTRRLDEYANVTCLPETGLFVHGDRFDLPDPESQPTDIDLERRIPWIDTESKTAASLTVAPEALRAVAGPGPFDWQAFEEFIDLDETELVVEKTPENVFAFGAHLRSDPEARFVVTTRSVREVVPSLMRRGMDLVPSVLIWFAHSYETARLLESAPDRVLQTRYDDLTDEPCSATDRILAFVGFDSGSSETEDSRFRSELMMGQQGLANTSWTRSAFERRDRTSGPVPEMIGLRLEILLQTLAFETAEHGTLQPSDIEAALFDARPLGSRSLGPRRPVRLADEGLYVGTLATRHPVSLPEHLT